MPYILLIAKLNAFGFHPKAFRLMNKSQGNQRTKTNKSCISWEQILFRVPQFLVLRPIFFQQISQ